MTAPLVRKVLCPADVAAFMAAYAYEPVPFEGLMLQWNDTVVSRGRPKATSDIAAGNSIGLRRSKRHPTVRDGHSASLSAAALRLASGKAGFSPRTHSLASRRRHGSRLARSANRRAARPCLSGSAGSAAHRRRGSGRGQKTLPSHPRANRRPTSQRKPRSRAWSAPPLPPRAVRVRPRRGAFSSSHFTRSLARPNLQPN